MEVTIEEIRCIVCGRRLFDVLTSSGFELVIVCRCKSRVVVRRDNGNAAEQEQLGEASAAPKPRQRPRSSRGGGWVHGWK